MSLTPMEVYNDKFAGPRNKGTLLEKHFLALKDPRRTREKYAASPFQYYTPYRLSDAVWRR